MSNAYHNSVQHLPPRFRCPMLHENSVQHLPWECTTPTSTLPQSHTSCKQSVQHLSATVPHFMQTVCTTPTSTFPLSHASHKQSVYNTYLHITTVPRFMQTVCTTPTSTFPLSHASRKQSRTGSWRLAAPVVSLGHDTMKTVSIWTNTPWSMPGPSSPAQQSQTNHFLSFFLLQQQ